MAENGFAPVGGGQLYYEVAGEGPALVLVHAGIADCRMWDDQMAAFSERYRVVRYDVRGFGRSSAPAGPYAHRDDLAALLDHLRFDSAHIVGVSMGGSIDLEFAVAYPARTRSLVLVGSGLPGYDWSPDTVKQWEEEEAAMKAGDTNRVVDINMRMWVYGPTRSENDLAPEVRHRAHDMLHEHYSRPQAEDEHRDLDPPAGSRLSEINVPTLVMAGSLDQVDIVAIADVLASRIAGARKVIIEGAAHLPNMERPEEFNRTVLAFLDSVEA